MPVINLIEILERLISKISLKAKQEVSSACNIFIMVLLALPPNLAKKLILNLGKAKCMALQTFFFQMKLVAVTQNIAKQFFDIEFSELRNFDDFQNKSEYYICY